MNIAEILKEKQKRILKEHEEVLFVSTLLSFKGNQLSQKYPTEVEVNKDASVDDLKEEHQSKVIEKIKEFFRKENTCVYSNKTI